MLNSLSIPFRSADGAQKADGVHSDSDLKKVGRFLLLVIVSIVLRYFAPPAFATIFFIVMLVLYARSKNEGFWLAYFMVLSDGFIGFFGRHEAMLTLIPGLPSIDISQIYIAISIVKAYKESGSYQPFYLLWIQVLAVYIVFLVAQGQILGLSSNLNIQFRVFKYLLPLALFYTLPKLFNKPEQYRELFVYLLPMTIFILGAQIFTMLNGKGITPAVFFGLKQKPTSIYRISPTEAYRGSFNENILFLTFFAALFFLIFRPQYFKNTYLRLALVANFISVFVSATRGWLIAYVFILFLSAVWVFRVNARNILGVVAFCGLLLFGAQFVPTFKYQIANTIERMLTLEKLAKGDVTAGGTLIRLSQRAPRVLKGWEQSPLTGLGFSNDFLYYADEHVANQNILMHSGVIGLLLMLAFMLSFVTKMVFRSLSLPRGHPYKPVLMLFGIFLLGWLMLHSSSQQFFYYYGYPETSSIAAIFFSMGALTYEQSKVDL